MDKITIPKHLLIPIIISMVGLGTVFFFRKKLFSRNRVLWISVTVFLAVYLLIVADAAHADLCCRCDLKRYDRLDKGGLLSEQEVSEKRKAAIERYANDTGRNLSFITGFIFALIISSVVYMGLSHTKLKNK